MTEKIEKKKNREKCECVCRDDISSTLTSLMLIAILMKLLQGTYSKKEEHIDVSVEDDKVYRLEIDTKKNISTQILITCSKAVEVSHINILGVTLNGTEVFVDVFPSVVENKQLDYHDIFTKFVKYIVEFVPNQGKKMNISCAIVHNRLEVG